MPASVNPPEGETDDVGRQQAACLLALAPAAQTGAQVVRFEAQCLADVDEAERPVPVLRPEPLLYVSEEPAGAPVG